MSIASEIEDLNTNLTAAKNAVTTKGGTVGDTGLAGLASEIATIPSGGSLANYGSITYLDANNVEQTLTLATEEDYLELTTGGTSMLITINGVDVIKSQITGVTIADGVTYIPGQFCNGCTNLKTVVVPSSVHFIGSRVFNGCDVTNASLSLDNVVKIEDNFLSSNSHFNSPISLPRIMEIGDGFLIYCGGFDSSLTINDDCEIIGSGFLRGCESFAQQLSLPSGIKTALVNPGDRFMQECKKFTGPLVCNCNASQMSTSNNVLSSTDVTAPLYVTGVTLTGTYANDWKTKFPDRTSSPYRKLVVGS